VIHSFPILSSLKHQALEFYSHAPRSLRPEFPNVVRKTMEL
jgi:hypothetical protein